MVIDPDKHPVGAYGNQSARCTLGGRDTNVSVEQCCGIGGYVLYDLSVNLSISLNIGHAHSVLLIVQSGPPSGLDGLSQSSPVRWNSWTGQK